MQLSVNLSNESNIPEGLSVVIPVYNSEAILSELIARLAPVLQEIVQTFNQTAAMQVRPAYEAILIDDGSQDDSWAEIQRISQTWPWVRGVHLMRNYGQHNALLCGLRLASFSTTITMDDDLQHPPQEIPLLLAQIEKGFDVVYGTPVKQQHGLWRNLASYITRLTLQGTMGVENARQGECAARHSNKCAPGIFPLPESVRGARCAAIVGHYSFYIGRNPPRTALPWSFKLHSFEIDPACGQYVDRVYGIATADGQLDGFRLCHLRYPDFHLRNWSFRDRRRQCTGFSIPRFNHCDFLRCSTFRLGHHWRIYGQDAF